MHALIIKFKILNAYYSGNIHWISKLKREHSYISNNL